MQKKNNNLKDIERMVSRSDILDILRHVQVSDVYSPTLVQNVSTICDDFEILQNDDIDDELIEMISHYRSWNAIESSATDHLLSEMEFYNDIVGVL